MDDWERIERELRSLARRKPEFRMRTYGPVQLLGIVAGYAVARAKGAMPFLISIQEFQELPLCGKDGDLIEEKKDG